MFDTISSILSNLRLLADPRLRERLRPATSTPPPQTVGPDSAQQLRRKDASDLAAIASRPGQTTGTEFNVREYSKSLRGPVYIASAAIARKVAEQEAVVKIRRETKSGVELEDAPIDHPLVQLLDNPNPSFTEWHLGYLEIIWLMLTGNSLTLKVRNGLGLPVELWPIPLLWAQPLPGKDRWIESWKLTGIFNKNLIKPADDIVHQFLPDADWSGSGRYLGVPPLFAGAPVMDSYDAIMRRHYWVFRNKVDPGLVFGTEMDYTPEQLLDAYADLRTQWTLLENNGAPMLLNKGTNLLSQGLRAPREMDFPRSTELTLDILLAIYGVPRSVVALDKQTNRATLSAAMEVFCNNTINPILRARSKVHTRDLAREFDEKLRVVYPPCSARDREDIRKDYEALLRSGAVTPNEVRREVASLPSYRVGGDHPIISANMLEAPWGNTTEAPMSMGGGEEKGHRSPQEPAGEAQAHVGSGCAKHEGNGHSGAVRGLVESRLREVATRVEHSGERGQLFWHRGSGMVHWEYADADTWGEGYTPLGEVEQMLEGVEGVRGVILADEYPPPRDQGWVQVWPMERDWVVGGQEGENGHPPTHGPLNRIGGA